MLKKIIRKAKSVIKSSPETLHTLYDRHMDKKICHCDLTRYVPSIYRESKGATGSQATHYRILDAVFDGITFIEKDSLIDVGCGKGRVLAYLIKQKFPGTLTGIELNADVAAIPREWSKRYRNVNIISGDAFELDLNQYNIFFLGRPFEPSTFMKFVAKFEKEITKKVTFIYWVDQQSGFYLNNRPGWKMLRHFKVEKLQLYPWLPIKLKCVPCPQGASIWEYDPQ